MKQQLIEAVSGAASVGGKVYPLGVAAATFAGLSLQQWVYVTAIAVAVCQLVSWGWRFYLWLNRKD